MRLFVTGATGYIGRQLCRRLLIDGHEVRAIVRRPERGAALAAAGVAMFPGDVTDRASMREAMSGADAVIHAAADLDLSGPPGRMEAVNVGGSENVATLAGRLGVPRLLSVASMACFGGSPDDGSPATESTPWRSPPTRYAATKRQGELAIRAVGARGPTVVTVYPGLVYGPPGKRDGSNVLLRHLWEGRFPFLVGADRQTSWVYIDDVVSGIVAALERGEPGAGYLLTGEIASVRSVAGRIHALGGAPVPRRTLPVPAARLALRLASPFYRLRRRRLPIPIEQLASLERHWAFDDRKARRELNWSPRGLDAGLPQLVPMLTATEEPAGAARGEQ